MLPRRQRDEKAPILPVVRTDSLQETHLPLMEVEANERPLPETDAQDTEIREMQAGEVAAGEIGHSGSRRSMAELEGIALVSEMDTREIAAAELRATEGRSMTATH